MNGVSLAFALLDLALIYLRERGYATAQLSARHAERIAQGHGGFLPEDLREFSTAAHRDVDNIPT